MQLELPIRWTETDKENYKMEELLKGNAAEEKIKYSYSRLLIDAHSIGPYYDLDENHTMINDKLGKIYCVTIPLDQFKKILTEITGNAIMTIQVREEYPRAKRDGKPPKDNGDNILL